MKGEEEEEKGLDIFRIYESCQQRDGKQRNYRSLCKKMVSKESEEDKVEISSCIWKSEIVE